MSRQRKNNRRKTNIKPEVTTMAEDNTEEQLDEIIEEQQDEAPTTEAEEPTQEASEEVEFDATESVEVEEQEIDPVSRNDIDAGAPSVSSPFTSTSDDSSALTIVKDYVTKMAPQMPQTPETIKTNQIVMYNAVSAIVLEEDVAAGAKELNQVIDIIANNEQGAFGDGYLFRGVDVLTKAIGGDKFEILMGVLKVIAEPRRTGAAIKITLDDLTKRLPDNMGEALLRKMKVITG